MKELRGLHLLTESTPNGQKVQIFLEELADAYGTKWTTTLMLVNQLSQLAQLLVLKPLFYSDTSTDEQKREWFLCLNPNSKPKLSL